MSNGATYYRSMEFVSAGVYIGTVKLVDVADAYGLAFKVALV